MKSLKTMACLRNVCFVFLIKFLIFETIFAYGGPKGYYSDQWLLKTSGGQRAAKQLADGNGFDIIAEVVLLSSSSTHFLAFNRNSVSKIQTHIFVLKYTGRYC